MHEGYFSLFPSLLLLPSPFPFLPLSPLLSIPPFFLLFFSSHFRSSLANCMDTVHLGSDHYCGVCAADGGGCWEISSFSLCSIIDKYYYSNESLCESTFTIFCIVILCFGFYYHFCLLFFPFNFSLRIV